MSLGFTGERIVPGASDCEPTFAQKMYQEHIARYAFAAQLAKDADVLDVGCGVGYGTQWLGKTGARSVLGFDISSEAIEHARMNYFHPAVTFKVQDATAIERGSGFDLVTCFELIEHIEKQEKVLDLIKAALREDGVLAISTPRPLDDIRTHFHVHEMSFEELFGLLKERFKYVEPFFEVNCFTSFVGRERPLAINQIVPVSDRLGMDHADYFVFLASDVPLDRAAGIEPVLTLNDDSYVLTLEKDTGVLRRAENEHLARIANLENEKLDLTAVSQRAVALSAIQDQASSIKHTVDLINNQVSAQLTQFADAQGLRVEIERLSTQLASQRLELTALEQKNGERDRQLTELELAVAQSELTIEERDRQIAELTAAPTANLEQVAELEQRLLSASDEANVLRKLLAETRERAAEHESRSYADLAAKAAQFDTLARETAQLREDLARRAEDLSAVRVAMASTAEQLTTAQTEAYQLRYAGSRLSEVEAHVSSLENELNALRYRNAANEATLARFRGSFSWALTRPLRWIWRNYRTLTGRSLPQ